MYQYGNMKRRHFLASIGALALISSAERVLACADADRQIQMPRGEPTHLGLEEARTILGRHTTSGECTIDVLDLSGFRTASPEAIAALSAIQANFAYMGFGALAKGTWDALSQWRCHFLMFDKVTRLDASAARSLPTCALTFARLDALGEDAAEIVAERARHHILSLGFNGKIEPGIARQLSRHEHELDLHVAGLDAEAAGYLSGHCGYRLEVRLEHELCPAALRSLQCNPDKVLEVTRRCGTNQRPTWAYLLQDRTWVEQCPV